MNPDDERALLGYDFSDVLLNKSGDVADIVRACRGAPAWRECRCGGDASCLGCLGRFEVPTEEGRRVAELMRIRWFTASAELAARFEPEVAR